MPGHDKVKRLGHEYVRNLFKESEHDILKLNFFNYVDNLFLKINECMD